MNPINIKDKFALINDYWKPRILGEVNDFYVKIFKAKGEFIWHDHKNEDEFFLIIKGQLHMKLRDGEVILKEGECFFMPRGVEHLPYAPEEVHLMLIEPKTVINTGDIVCERTLRTLERI